jgi:hypothetical protein
MEAHEQVQPSVAALSTLLQLEGSARVAQSVKELQFLAVNETRRLLVYRQAFFLKAGNRDRTPYRVEAASSVAAIERDAPLILWVEQVIQSTRSTHRTDAPLRLSLDEYPDEIRTAWKEWSFPYVLWCPLRHPNQSILGGLWLARETPWQETDLTLVQRLTETYAHAWKALEGRKNIRQSRWLHSGLIWLIAAGAAVGLCLPVRFSTLAPAKIVAKDPAVVSAPIDGVIARILVPPNTKVAEGEMILLYEDTNLRNQFEVADKNLAVALAEYRQAAQSAFQDAESQTKLPLLKAEAELRQAERDYAKELLDQVQVKASRAGLLLYTDESDWIGRPVVVGERIMDIADPAKVEARIDLPVEDAIVLKEGAEVQLSHSISPRLIPVTTRPQGFGRLR